MVGCLPEFRLEKWKIIQELILEILAGHVSLIVEIKNTYISIELMKVIISMTILNCLFTEIQFKFKAKLIWNNS